MSVGCHISSFLDVSVVLPLTLQSSGTVLPPRAHSVNQQAQPHRHTMNIACHKNVTKLQIIIMIISKTNLENL